MIRDEWTSPDGSVRLILGDCLEILPILSGIDAIVTDPPYPDIDKGFVIVPIDVLATLNCRQFIFWSAVEIFPLNWTAIHIWHKPNGRSSQHYERIFERNGNRVCRVWRFGCVNSFVAAQMCYDKYYDHPCQKPLLLIEQLVKKAADAKLICDPFMGSSTTGVACIRTGRRFIGIEIEPKYWEIAVRRCQAELDRFPLFDPPRPRQTELFSETS